LKNFSAKSMKIFHECWIFHALFDTIERGYRNVADLSRPHRNFRYNAALEAWDLSNNCWELLEYQELAAGCFFRVRTGVSAFERNFERKMKRYHCTIVQSVVS
jgi:hypothetical protein